VEGGGIAYSPTTKTHPTVGSWRRIKKDPGAAGLEEGDAAVPRLARDNFRRGCAVEEAVWEKQDEGE